jgi:hypothetical protein
MTTSSKPFSIDTKTHPAVVAAHEQLTARHKAKVAATKAEYEANLEILWERSEQKRKADWCAKQRYDNPPRRVPNLSADLTDAGIVRIATPAQDRIRVLGEVFTETKDLAFLTESLKIFLYRSHSKAKLPDVLEFLSEWIPTAGDEELFTEIRSTHFVNAGPVGHGMKNVPATERRAIASGLSPEVMRVLQGFKIKSGMVYFVTNVEFEDRPGQPVSGGLMHTKMRSTCRLSIER